MRGQNELLKLLNLLTREPIAISIQILYIYIHAHVFFSVSFNQSL